MKETHPAKSVVIGRMPRAKKEDPYKTAFIKLYSELEPLKSDSFPQKELTYSNIERVVFRNVTMDYFLEGNDLVVEPVNSVEIEQVDRKIYLTFK